MSDEKVRELAIKIAESLDENLASDILVLRLTGLTSIADYFVIATGNNNRHLKALGRFTIGVVDENDSKVLGEEGTPESGWILIDAGDIVVHLFDSARRDLYNLEMLWGDAKEVYQAKPES